MKFDDYLKEGKKEDESIRAWAKENQYKSQKLEDSYYAVADNIGNLASLINRLNGDTGLFTNDLKNIKKSRDAFMKITLGKYL